MPVRRWSSAPSGRSARRWSAPSRRGRLSPQRRDRAVLDRRGADRLRRPSREHRDGRAPALLTGWTPVLRAGVRTVSSRGAAAAASFGKFVRSLPLACCDREGARDCPTRPRRSTMRNWRKPNWIWPLVRRPRRAGARTSTKQRSSRRWTNGNAPTATAPPGAPYRPSDGCPEMIRLSRKSFPAGLQISSLDQATLRFLKAHLSRCYKILAP